MTPATSNHHSIIAFRCVAGRGAGVARTFGVGEAGGSIPLVPTIIVGAAPGVAPFFLKTGTARIAPAFIFEGRSAAILAPFALKSGTPASWRL